MVESECSYGYDSASEVASEDEKEYFADSASGSQMRQLNYTVISPVKLNEIQVTPDLVM